MSGRLSCLPLPCFLRRAGIDERQRFLRIVPVGPRQTDCEWHAPAIADQMAFATGLGSIRRTRTGLLPAAHCTHGTTIDDGARPLNLAVASEAVQQHEVDEIPYAGLLPIA